MRFYPQCGHVNNSFQKAREYAKEPHFKNVLSGGTALTTLIVTTKTLRPDKLKPPIRPETQLAKTSSLDLNPSNRILI